MTQGPLAYTLPKNKCNFQQLMFLFEKSVEVGIGLCGWVLDYQFSS